MVGELMHNEPCACARVKPVRIDECANHARRIPRVADALRNLRITETADVAAGGEVVRPVKQRLKEPERLVRPQLKRRGEGEELRMPDRPVFHARTPPSSRITAPPRYPHNRDYSVTTLSPRGAQRPPLPPAVTWADPQHSAALAGLRPRVGGVRTAF